MWKLKLLNHNSFITYKIFLNIDMEIKCKVKYYYIISLFTIIKSQDIYDINSNITMRKIIDGYRILSEEYKKMIKT